MTTEQKEQKVDKMRELANQLISMMDELQNEITFSNFNPQSVYQLEEAMYDLNCDLSDEYEE